MTPCGMMFLHYYTYDMAVNTHIYILVRNGVFLVDEFLVSESEAGFSCLCGTKRAQSRKKVGSACDTCPSVHRIPFREKPYENKKNDVTDVSVLD